MNPTSYFHPPFPGDTARFYCFHCKKSFNAKVPEKGIFSVFQKFSNQGRVKCPDCKKLCGLDPRIQY